MSDSSLGQWHLDLTISWLRNPINARGRNYAARYTLDSCQNPEAVRSGCSAQRGGKHRWGSEDRARRNPATLLWIWVLQTWATKPLVYLVLACGWHKNPALLRGACPRRWFQTSHLILILLTTGSNAPQYPTLVSLAPRRSHGQCPPTNRRQACGGAPRARSSTGKSALRVRIRPRIESITPSGPRRRGGRYAETISRSNKQTRHG